MPLNERSASGKYWFSLTFGFAFLGGNYTILHITFPLKSPVAEKMIKVKGLILFFFKDI